MNINDVFVVGVIMEMEDKSKSIKVLDDNDCLITSKSINKNKVILHMVRESDGSEGNVFVSLREDHGNDFAASKTLLASKHVVGLTLGQFKKLSMENL